MATPPVQRRDRGCRVRPWARFRARVEPDRSGRHRLDDIGDRVGADDVHPRAGAVLLRHGAQEKHSRHHGPDAAVHDALLRAVGGGGVQPGVQRRWRDSRHAGPPGARRHRSADHEPARQNHPRSPVHDLSDDLRGHHRRAGRGLGRRPHALFRLRLVRRGLAVPGLCPARPLGVGRGMACEPRRARFRRRPCRASERGNRGTGRRLCDRPALRLRLRQFCVEPACFGSAGSASTAVRRSEPIRARCSPSSRPTLPPRPAH